eukprot:CAMPEP_0181540620 /NCGR_PEP_ID=MMETSP1110-20121109/76984_1 /TAXON_ID=174948 /ORGANISM="Symbiodinium sp., Strain CCMP421" /LENGTH=93 /DNA_ID=CAMNT_0023672275 /DNA_START=158 /DNA_END=439 /DNA_ORIENTATION=-
MSMDSLLSMTQRHGTRDPSSRTASRKTPCRNSMTKSRIMCCSFDISLAFCSSLRLMYPAPGEAVESTLRMLKSGGTWRDFRSPAGGNSMGVPV